MKRTLTTLLLWLCICCGARADSLFDQATAAYRAGNFDSAASLLRQGGYGRPASGTLQNLVVASNGVGGATFSEGASGNSLSGVFYFPSAPITMSGAGNVGNGSGQCLELIGSTISLSGG